MSRKFLQVNVHRVIRILASRRFAAAEAQFSRPFRADVVNQMLRTSQIILGEFIPRVASRGTDYSDLCYVTIVDRMRECRTAIGTKPLPDAVVHNFTRILVPYRRRNTQILQLAFFLIASSATAKTPLPRETPAELENAGQVANLMHDILVLASRHARTPEGVKTIRSGDFTRYFHYLVCITSLPEHLKVRRVTFVQNPAPDMKSLYSCVHVWYEIWPLRHVLVCR